MIVAFSVHDVSMPQTTKATTSPSISPQQSGSCCDCGDPEAWRVPIGCRYHPPLNDSTHTPTQSTPKASYRKLDSPSIPPPQMDRSSVPLDLLDSMTRSISYALEFIIDTLDYSPEECNVPENEEALLGQPSQDPTEKDLFAIVLWNDEKHAFSEVNRQLVETCGCTLEEAVTHTDRMDEEGRGVVEAGQLQLSTIRNCPWVGEGRSWSDGPARL